MVDSAHDMLNVLAGRHCTSGRSGHRRGSRGATSRHAGTPGRCADQPLMLITTLSGRGKEDGDVGREMKGRRTIHLIRATCVSLLHFSSMLLPTAVLTRK